MSIPRTSLVLHPSPRERQFSHKRVIYIAEEQSRTRGGQSGGKNSALRIILNVERGL